MSLWATFRLALRALWRNRVRSFLTLVGIVFGIGAVIGMVASGRGAQEAVREVFSAMGTNLLIVSSGSQPMFGAAGGAGSKVALTWQDLEALRQGQVPEVKWVAPVVQARRQVAADDANWQTSIVGTTPDYFAIKSWAATAGALFDDDAAAVGAKVACVGKTVATQLFGAEAKPVGQVMRIAGQPYDIVCVLDGKGQSAMGSDNDDVVVIPHKTYLAKIEQGLGKYLKGQLYVSVRHEREITSAETKLSNLLRELHKVPAGGEDDFRIRNLAEFALSQKKSTERISTLLAIVAAVSLLVGGIGVMNIMLVSVIERTREIGIRMAVGAKPNDIMLQFLVEALVLGILGGVLGIAAGAGAAKAMAEYFSFKFIFPASTAMLAFGVSCAVGVVFGLYPAVRASRLDPISALRYES